MSIFETIYPRKINIGDTIGIAAPAGSFNRERFNSGVGILENMGFNIFMPDQLMQEDRWFAGDDDTRVSVLHNLFLDPDVKAIVCARGGYGSMRLLEKIDFDIVRAHPKIFAGFSDITVLLSAFYERAGLVCYHAPVVTSLIDADDLSLKVFRSMLTDDKPFSMIADEDTGCVVCSGQASGIIQGGNLTTLNHLTGTEFMPELDGKVLLLEDIAEPAYKIDRMLTQMRLAGIFSGIRGIVLGQFEDCGRYEAINSIFKENFKDKGIPVISGFGFGHSKRNLAFPIGAEITLDSRNLSVVCSQ